MPVSQEGDAGQEVCYTTAAERACIMAPHMRFATPVPNPASNTSLVAPHRPKHSPIVAQNSARSHRETAALSTALSMFSCLKHITESSRRLVQKHRHTQPDQAQGLEAAQDDSISFNLLCNKAIGSDEWSALSTDISALSPVSQSPATGLAAHLKTDLSSGIDAVQHHSMRAPLAADGEQHIHSSARSTPSLQQPVSASVAALMTNNDAFEPHGSFSTAAVDPSQADFSPLKPQELSFDGAAAVTCYSNASWEHSSSVGCRASGSALPEDFLAATLSTDSPGTAAARLKPSCTTLASRGIPSGAWGQQQLASGTSSFHAVSSDPAAVASVGAAGASRGIRTRETQQQGLSTTGSVSAAAVPARDDIALHSRAEARLEVFNGHGHSNGVDVAWHDEDLLTGDYAL